MVQAKMSKKTAETVVDQDDDEQQAPEVQAWADQSEYTPPWLELDKIKAEFDTTIEEISFQIFRQGDGGIKDLRFVKAVSRDVFSYELLQGPPFNGGRFRVYVRKEGSGAIRRNFVVDVEAGPDAVKAGATPPTQEQGLSAMIAAMSAGFNTLSQQIARQQAAPVGMGIQETIALIASLKPLLAPAPNYQAPPVDPFDMITKIVSLQRDLAPPPLNADGEVSGTAILLKAMETFGPAIGNAMAKSPAQAQQDAQAYEQAPNPAPALPAPDPQAPAPFSSVTQEQPQMNELQMKIAVFKPALILMAGSNADPYPYACMVLDMFDDDQIRQYISADDWWTQLQTIIPEAAPYHEWFVNLRKQVIELLQEGADGASVAA